MLYVMHERKSSNEYTVQLFIVFFSALFACFFEKVR